MAAIYTQNLHKTFEAKPAKTGSLVDLTIFDSSLEGVVRVIYEQAEQNACNQA